MSGQKSAPSGAARVIKCRRVPGGYEIYTRYGLLSQFRVLEQADDQLNTDLRDAIVTAFYQYGKELGIWN